MVIKSGYWNYYMSFRISDNKKLFRDIHEKNYVDTVMGVALEGEILQNERVSTGYSDKLKNSLFSEIAEIHECNRIMINLTRECNKRCWQLLSLMPLKVEKKPFEYEFCPVYLYLFENGHAIIKTSISIDGVDESVFSTYPMQTWFGDIKAWEAAIQRGGDEEYKICREDGRNISIVTHILQQYIYRLFEGNLLDEKRFACFESFVVAERDGKQLWEIAGKGSLAEKEELYHFTNPEESMTKLTTEKWYDFWKSSYESFSGINFIKGHNCRLIITTDVAKLKKHYHRFDIKDTGTYLNVSIQRTFDFFLVLALCQKDGELYLAAASNKNIHDIEKQTARYNQNCNFFEMFLDAVPYNARMFYSMIRSINDDSFVDVKTRIERIKQMNIYQRNMFIEKRTLIIEVVALIGTVLFGLPALYDTLVIIRETFLPPEDLIQGNATQIIAIVIWGFLIAAISKYLIMAYRKYQNKKI